MFGEPAGDVERAHRHLAYVPADVALWPSLHRRRSAWTCWPASGPAPTSPTATSWSSGSSWTSTSGPAPTPPATGRRWRWSRRSPRGRRCWCWTSRPAAWTRSWSASSAAASARRPNAGRRSSSARTSWPRSRRSAPGSASCAPGGWSRSPASTSCAGCAAPRSSSTSPGPAPELATAGRAARGRRPAVDWPPRGSRCRSPARPDRCCAPSAEADVAALDVREPSLEEIFLDYYGAGGGVTTRTAARRGAGDRSTGPAPAPRDDGRPWAGPPACAGGRSSSR